MPEIEKNATKLRQSFDDDDDTMTIKVKATFDQIR